MSSEVAKSNNGGNQTGGAAVSYSPWREMLGYDPFRRFFSNLDPEIDVVRTERGFEVEIPVAGFRPEQVEITVKDDVLTVSGKNERRAFTLAQASRRPRSRKDRSACRTRNALAASGAATRGAAAPDRNQSELADPQETSR